MKGLEHSVDTTTPNMHGTRLISSCGTSTEHPVVVEQIVQTVNKVTQQSSSKEPHRFRSIRITLMTLLTTEQIAGFVEFIQPAIKELSKKSLNTA